MNAQGSAIAVVNAASYQTAAAPDSIASLFGANLSAITAPATLGDDGQLPVQLGGVTVEVDGVASALLFVSPLQINFIVPGKTASGTANVVVRTIDTGAIRSGTMQVQVAAPGIFTGDASGTGAGSILNAVTYAGPPFLVETTANGGNDLRTRLAVYATGLRNAESVLATAQDSAGNRYTLSVEYAGAAPGYFGLDQLNVVLPPELDGAGVVSLNLSTVTGSSNIVTFQMGSLPADSVRLISLSFSKPFVTSGDSITGTLSLNAPARSIGLAVSLRSSSPSLQFPLSLTIPAGNASLDFTVTASVVATVQNVTVTAQGGGISQSASLEIDPVNSVQINSFTATPSRVQGGRAATATAVLSGPAPGGATLEVASDNSAAAPPATVPVVSGTSTVSFSIPTVSVNSSQTANITATFGRTSKGFQLTVVPVIDITLQSSSVTGGNNINGAITLGEPAPPAGVALNLQCDNRTIAQPPLSVNIPSGQVSVPFTVTTIPVTVSRTVNISVTFGGATDSVPLTVNPPGSATLSNLTIAPPQVTGGTSATGTVMLGAPAPVGGVTVGLVSSAAFAAQAPGFVTVLQGQTSANFTVTTTRVSTEQTLTITAAAGGVSRTATLKVQ